MGLSKDIINVTDAEPDICLEVFYALYHTLWPQIENLHENERLRGEMRLITSLQDAWKNFIGSSMFKGILCPPEKLICKKRPKDIKKILSQSEGEERIFQDLDRVLESIFNLKQKIIGFPEDLLYREEITASLDLVEEFYKGYRDKMKALVQAILEKEQMNYASGTEHDALLDLLEPKAVMMSDIFDNHWAYRIPRSKAQKLLSLDENALAIQDYPGESFTHRVAALPEESEPLVYFKANGRTAIQPEKEFMCYSLFRQFKIPIPETALLILTDVFQEDSDYFYAVQASEAVIGESARRICENQETIFDQEAYVSQVIAAFLTNPSGGKFEDFRYSQKYKTLISIDNDLIFKPEFAGNNDNKIVNVKSILYLLPQIDLPIPESIKSFFTSLDVHLTIFSWLKDLSQKNQQYNLLFTRLAFQKTRHTYQSLRPQSEIPSLKSCLQQKVQVDPDLHNDSFYPQILISKSLIANLTEKLQIIESVLVNSSPGSTQILFEEISPILGKYYRKLRLEFSDIEESPLMLLEESSLMLLEEALWGEKFRGIDYSEVKSLLSQEEIDSLSNNQSDSDEGLLPVTLLQEYKSKLISKESPIDQFIKRHTQRKKRNLLNLREVLEELRLLIQEELTNSQSIQDIVDFWYSISRKADSETDENIIKEITLLLSRFPNAELRWLMTLERYFLRSDCDVPENSRVSSVPITGAFMKQRTFVLTESEERSLFDQHGNIKKNASLTGRSNVNYFPANNPEFYLKQYPEFPGYEFASTLFMRILGIKFLPYHDLILINDSYPVLLSQKVEGNPVHQAWNKPQAFDNLDPVHTVLLIIAAMLLNPEDGKEDNFILSEDGKYLIPIDNDHYFLPSTFQKKGDFWNLFAVNTALQTKTLLFCLDEMRRPIPVEVRNHIISLDFDLLFTSWMEELVKIQDKYNNFIKEDQRKRFLEHGTITHILFYEQFINNMHWKAHKIKDLLTSKSDLAPFDLLKAIEPFAARSYENSFNQGNKLQSRFKEATSQLYTKPPVNGSRVSVFNTQTFMEIVNISEKDLRNDVALQRMSPLNTLDLLKQLIQGRSEKIQKEQELLCELDDKDQEKKFINLFGKSLTETALKEFFANPKEGLILKGSKLITSSKLKELFAQTFDKGMKIRFLSLPNSPLLTGKEIKILAVGCPNIEYLNVNGCAKLNEISLQKEEWPLLARVEARDCPTLEKFVSFSPLKILRIRTPIKIEIFVEKDTLDLFTISREPGTFELSLRKGENFDIRLFNKILTADMLFLAENLEKEELLKQLHNYFKDLKITI